MPFEADQRAHRHVELPDLLNAAEMKQAASKLAPRVVHIFIFNLAASGIQA